MDLDDEDYELLGYGVGPPIEEAIAKYVSLMRERRNERDRESYKLPETKKYRYQHLKKWRAKNPEKVKAIDKKYFASAKGKSNKAKSWKRYYAVKRVELIEKNRARRAAQKEKRT